MQPIAAFVHEPRHRSRAERDAGRDPRRRRRRGISTFVDATGLATALLGDCDRHQPRSCSAMPGRRASCRCRCEAIKRAIELNGVAVETNKRTFAWGRLAAHDLAARAGAAQADAARRDAGGAARWTKSIAKRAELLGDYQDAGLRRALPRSFVDKVAQRREAKGAGLQRAHRGGRQVALQADGLQGRVRGGAALHRRRVRSKKLGKQFEGDFQLNFHLAPPLFAAAIRRPASSRSASTAPG